jgi:hypothetical protein
MSLKVTGKNIHSGYPRKVTTRRNGRVCFFRKVSKQLFEDFSYETQAEHTRNGAAENGSSE